MKQLVMGLTLCACCAAFAGGQKPQLQVAPMGQKLVPQRIAGVARINGQVVRTTEWFDYDQSEGGGGIAAQGDCTAVTYSACGANSVIFDVFEADPATGVPTDLDGSCVASVPVGSRYYFGAAVFPNNPFATNDMAPCPDAVGPVAGLDIAWFWGLAALRDMDMLIFINGDFSATCADPDTSIPGAGVIISFAPNAGSAAGYYYSNVDLCNVPIPLPALPPGGLLSYDVILGQDTPAGFVLDAAAGTQPMLWGDENQPTSAGFSPNPIQWDDDNPQSGIHERIPPDATSECYNYGYGLCVDPLGSCVAFREGGGTACDPCDANCDGSINLFDIDPFVAILSGGAGCGPCTGDANNDGSINLFDIDPFVDCLSG